MKFLATLVAVVRLVSALAPINKRNVMSINPDPAALHLGKFIKPVSSLETFAKHLRSESNTRQSQGIFTVHSGILEARALDGSLVGYLASTLNDFGEYELATNISNAVALAFEVPSDNSLFSVYAPTDGSLTYPFLGGIAGYANDPNTRDLGPGSLNYAYLGGVLEDIAPGPATVRGNTFTDASQVEAATESVMWKFETATSILSPQWINTDASTPITHLVTIQDLFVITGDTATLIRAFGPATEVLFVLVQSHV